MAKRKRKSTRMSEERPHPRWQRLLVPGLLGVAVSVGVAIWLFLLKPSPQSFAAQFQGGPRLAVENAFLDFGNVRFEKFVTARFHVRNVGDRTLLLAANPPVEVVEGC
jgi:hypothetical protein